MKKKKIQSLEMPMDFRVACTLYSFDPMEVLQAFIDHVSVYCFMGGGPLDGYCEATSIITDMKPVDSVKLFTGEIIGIGYNMAAARTIRELGALCISTKDSEYNKYQSSRGLVDTLFKCRAEYRRCPEYIFVGDGLKLVFSKDYRILCELHSTDAIKYLECFMSDISIADIRAKISLKIPLESMAQLFFFDYLNNKRDYLEIIAPLTEATELYIKELQKLNAKHFIVRNLQKRTELYREFFLTHYNNILKEKGG